MRAIRWLAYAVCVVALVPVYGNLAEMLPPGLGILAILIVPLFGFVVTLVHELGHAAAAHRVGADLVRIVVLPFAYDVPRQRFATEAPKARGEVGGYVRYTLNRIDARRKHMVIAVAGPVANLVFAAALFAVAGLIATHSDGVLPDGRLPSHAEVRALAAALNAARARENLGHVLEMIGWLSAVIGLVNLLPFDDSDGAQLLASARRGRARRG